MMVCHFYRDATLRCKIVDKHFEILAKKYWKTRFVKIDAEKCEFLVQRFMICVLPTMTCCLNGSVTAQVIGFDDMGGGDNFKTDALAIRLAAAQVLDYQPGHHDDELAAAQKEAGKGKGYIGHRRVKGDSDSDCDSDEW